MQESRISIANAQELRLSCINLSIYTGQLDHHCACRCPSFWWWWAINKPTAGYKARHVFPKLIMMTSSNGNIFHNTGLCVGNSPVTGDFPSQRPAMRIFDVFFDLRLNKGLSKPSRCWWFETPSRSLWRHCNVCHFWKWLTRSCEMLRAN